MPAIWIGAAGALAGGLGGMLGGNAAAKAQKKHYKWIQQQTKQAQGVNQTAYGQAMGEQRQGLLAMLQAQRNQQKMFGKLGAGAGEQINRSAQRQLGDISQMAALGGINSRFLGARSGVMQNQALALNQLQSQLAGVGMGMHAGFGQQMAAQRAGMAGTHQNFANTNAAILGQGAGLATQAAPTGYSPGGDFLAALGQGVNFFAGLQSLQQQPGAGTQPGGYSNIPYYLQSNSMFWDGKP